MNRVQRIVQHVSAGQDSAENPLKQCPTAATYCSGGAAKADDDVVICCSIRTAVGKASKGYLKDTPAEELLVAMMHELVKRTGVDVTKIGDCQIGNVLQPGAGAAMARVAQMMAGWPIEVPVVTVNRQCSSGIQTMANIAASIKSGVIDVGVAGGVESMSAYKITSGIDEKKMSQEVYKNELAAACLLSMGVTSENVAAKWGISREKQDKLAMESNAKAIAAQKAGLFDSEIVPIETQIKDKKTGEVKKVVMKVDEGPREATTMESLGKLKPAFKKDGSTTPGNSSQLSDGCALMLLARRSVAKEMGLPIVARLRSFAVVGVDPNLMGIGPAFAIPPALEKAGLKVEDVDVWEINEAFASQATMSIEHLKIPMEKVNPKGGAIAMGHPLGATGARQMATLLPELKRQSKKLGVVSMCIGSGMGAATVVESEQ